VIATLLSATLFAVGCGGGDGGGDDGSDRSVEWHVDRDGVVGPRSARLTAVIETCIAPVWLERPIIEYSGARAYLELRHTPERGEGEHNGCLLGLSVLHKTVSLERDLDELVLFDASTDPPEQRWPRRP